MASPGHPPNLSRAWRPGWWQSRTLRAARARGGRGPSLTAANPGACATSGRDAETVPGRTQKRCPAEPRNDPGETQRDDISTADDDDVPNSSPQNMFATCGDRGPPGKINVVRGFRVSGAGFGPVLICVDP